MSNVSRGHGRERELVKRLRAEGRWAIRAPASLGSADVIASPPLTFYEVKCTAGGPYSHFLPRDRARLLEDAAVAGAQAVLCWWPADRQGPRFIPADEWP